MHTQSYCNNPPKIVQFEPRSFENVPKYDTNHPDASGNVI